MNKVYEKTLQFIYDQLPVYQRDGSSAYKVNLNNTIALLEALANPHKRLKTIHIAGTNGKGSVAFMLASVLKAQGLKVGLYTSPHFKDFRERIRVNGHKIPEDLVTEFVNKNYELIQKVEPSFFEISVVMAFDFFASISVDIAVIETGLGGRLDSTNVVLPEVSVITNIGYDHMQFLGNDLASIAKEKAGIIKERVPVVVGKYLPETKTVFDQAARDKDCTIYYAEEIYEINHSLKTIQRNQIFNVYKHDKISYRELEIDLLGKYQLKNVKTALATIDVLREVGWQIDKISVYAGFSKLKAIGLKGKWQVIGYHPLIICDAAHNTDGIKNITGQVKDMAWKNLFVITGFVNDKPIDDLVRLFPEQGSYFCVKPDIKRGLAAEETCKIFVNAGFEAVACENAKSALERILSVANKNDLVLICGSTFLVAEFL